MLQSKGFFSGMILALFALALLVPLFLIPLNEIEIPEIIVEEVEEAGAGEEHKTYAGGTESEIMLPKEATFVFPLADSDWQLTSPWGVRMSPIYKMWRFHNGVDISVANNRNVIPQIVAIADGYIEHHWYNHRTKGRYVVVNHEWGRSHYAHMSETYIHERKSDGTRWQVRAGETIGRMGDTGVSDGPHLHFELELFIAGKSTWVNPMLYLNEVLPEWEDFFVRESPPFTVKIDPVMLGFVE